MVNFDDWDCLHWRALMAEFEFSGKTCKGNMSLGCFANATCAYMKDHYANSPNP
jgi:hypothetical protein